MLLFTYLFVYRSVLYQDIYKSYFRRGLSFFVCIDRHCKRHCRQLRKDPNWHSIILWFTCCNRFSCNRSIRNAHVHVQYRYSSMFSSYHGRYFPFVSQFDCTWTHHSSINGTFVINSSLMIKTAGEWKTIYQNGCVATFEQNSINFSIVFCFLFTCVNSIILF